MPSWFGNRRPQEFDRDPRRPLWRRLLDALRRLIGR
jgi:hypothetical protein